jgi:iron complex transport system ATP-binding protein
MRLDIDKVACGYGKTKILEDVSISVSSGEVLCLLGPNGVGKTTLFKTLLGFLKPLGGEILLDGESITGIRRNRLARSLAYVPQAHTPPFPFRVIDVVVMGRTAHLGMFASPTKQDMQIAEEALETLNISFLRDRIYTEISGGERQMVFIARALTQQPDLLVLDEPTSNLDFGNQIRVLQQINNLAKRGLGVIMTSHFPNHAFLCATKVALLCRSSSFIIGDAVDVITEQNLKKAYGINVKIASTSNGFGDEVKTCVPLLN